MKKLTSISLLLLLLTGSSVTLAEDHQHKMNHGVMQDHHDGMTKGHWAEGMVNKIDIKHKKVNMTHGPIKTLGWSGMTMDFAVKNAAILKSLKAGEKVTFEVVKEGKGKYFITSITPK